MRENTSPTLRSESFARRLAAAPPAVFVILAGFRERGNVGFLMYVADSTGYLGSVLVLLWRNFGTAGQSWLSFYTGLCYAGAGAVLVLALGSWWYFYRKQKGRAVSETVFSVNIELQ